MMNDNDISEEELLEFIKSKRAVWGSYKYIAKRIEKWEKTKPRNSKEIEEIIYNTVLREAYRGCISEVDGKLVTNEDKISNHIEISYNMDTKEKNAIESAIDAVEKMKPPYSPQKKKFYSWLKEKELNNYEARVRYLSKIIFLSAFSNKLFL